MCGYFVIHGRGGVVGQLELGLQVRLVVVVELQGLGFGKAEHGFNIINLIVGSRAVGKHKYYQSDVDEAVQAVAHRVLLRLVLHENVA